jgi:hypothetical protein
VKRLVVALGSLAITGAIVWLVLNLGAWGFGYRQLSFHDGRLARLVARKPALDHVLEGLRGEGFTLLAAPTSALELRELAARLGPAFEASVIDKAARSARVRAVSSEDFVYVLYFDGEDVLRDYTCLALPEALRSLPRRFDTPARGR